jgi:hypothetical protein
MSLARLALRQGTVSTVPQPAQITKASTTEGSAFHRARNRMPHQRLMAILTSTVDPATPHLDHNNIHRRVINAPILTEVAYFHFPTAGIFYADLAWRI